MQEEQRREGGRLVRVCVCARGVEKKMGSVANEGDARRPLTILDKNTVLSGIDCTPGMHERRIKAKLMRPGGDAPHKKKQISLTWPVCFRHFRFSTQNIRALRSHQSTTRASRYIPFPGLADERYGTLTLSRCICGDNRKPPQRSNAWR